MINKYIYKKILEKMNLSKAELLKLKKELREDNICYGPFVKDNKMCPTTTALSIKLKVDKFRNNYIVSKKLKEIGIKKIIPRKIPIKEAKILFIKIFKEVSKVFKPSNSKIISSI